MARDILGEYGPEANKPQAARATSGGEKTARDVMGYRPPQGPIGIGDSGPGLHGDNHGNASCPVAGRGSGSAGLHGTTKPGGSQRG
jgi:hypothetical protein